MALPEPTEIARLLPEELAPLVLQDLTNYGRHESRFNYTSYCTQHGQLSVRLNAPQLTHQILEDARRSLAEACSHLLQLGFVAYDTDHAYGWVFVTRRGMEAAASQERFQRQQIRARFPPETFHRLLRGPTYDAFVGGNFQQSIGDAFRVPADGVFVALQMGW